MSLQSKVGIVCVKRLSKSFIQSFFQNQKQLMASITLEKQYKMSLVDSSIGSFEQIKSDTIGKVYFIQDTNYISIEFDPLITNDRAFELGKLLFDNLNVSKFIVLSELESLNYISSNPEERIVAPLLRMLSTNPTNEVHSFFLLFLFLC